MSDFALAKRCNLIKPSPTLAVTGLANKLKAEGKDIIGFGAGEPDFDTPVAIKDAAKKALDAGDTKYPATPGTTALKDALIHKLKRDNNLDYTRDEIIVSNGGKHSLFNLFMVTINPGDEVIIPAPYWVSYPEQINFFEGKPIILNTTDKTQFKITPQQLKEAITTKTKFLLLNSPSNPTGTAYTKEELEALGKVCTEKDIWIVSDEIYEHIVYDGFEQVSIASLSEDLQNRTIIVNGASKCYSMTGWRMGFTASKNKSIIKAMGKLQGQSTSGVCSITQAACVEAFNGDLGEVHKMLAAFKERRDYIVKALNEINGITCTNPVGAFYVFPNVSGTFGKTTPNGQKINNDEDFCMYLLNEHLVAAVQGSAFGADGYMRLSYATSMENIKKGIERIQKAVSTLKN